MSYEDSLINLINGVMPDAPLRKSRSGEADAELILLGDREYLFTTDEFSAEDLLWEADPFDLGWNLACGAISDIIAAGGRPLVYSHAMVIPPAWDSPYILGLSRGISAVLQEYGVSFAGGDLGRAEKWRYTASVIGAPVGKALSRRACRAGDAIFITGRIGSGNLMAALSMQAENRHLEMLLKEGGGRFSIHAKLPGIITRYASCAIDTSDGVLAALQTIADLNGTGFKLDRLPFLSRGVSASSLLGLPLLLLLMGECGEYEILFTVDQAGKDLLKAELRLHDIEANEIGEISADPCQRTVRHEQHCYDLAGYDIRARDFDRVRDYLQMMSRWLEQRGEDS